MPENDSGVCWYSGEESPHTSTIDSINFSVGLKEPKTFLEYDEERTELDQGIF